jgi:hypothetical protein
VETATARQSSFWAETLPDVQARWALIARAGQVLLAAQAVQQATQQSAGLDAAALLAAYTEGERPLCLLDTYYRHMERQYHNFDFDRGDQEKQLEQLIVRARQRYMAVGDKLAETFLQQYRQAGFTLPGALRQREIYASKVQAALAQGKTAYVWVDALRFEMGRELAQTLADKYEVTIEAADLTLLTWREIDSLCEGGNIPLARRTMDGIMHELNRAFQVLAGLGVKTIVFTADHGCLFGEALSLDMKIDPPGGDTAVVASGITWTLTHGSEKITTRFFSLQIKGMASGLFGLEPPKIQSRYICWMPSVAWNWRNWIG